MAIDDEATADNMVIQSAKLLEQHERDTNGLYMRAKEWYGQHFPELLPLTEGDAVLYVACVRAIGDRANLAVIHLF